MTGNNQNKFFNHSDITPRIQQLLHPHIGKFFRVKAEISSSREIALGLDKAVACWLVGMLRLVSEEGLVVFSGGVAKNRCRRRLVREALDRFGNRFLDAKVRLCFSFPYCSERHVYHASELACPFGGERS